MSLNKRLASLFQADAERITLWSKGRVGLYALLKALGVCSGDEIIVTGYTCVMVPSAPFFLGAVCRYVDIDPGTYNLNPALLDSAVSDRTRAIIVQHTYGIAQDMEPVLQWASKRGLPVIEDCCHAVGSRYRGKLCGTFGAGAFFSGQWNKPFSTGLGGMLVVNDQKLLNGVRSLYQTAANPSAIEDLRIRGQILAYRALVNPRTVMAITRFYRFLSGLGLAIGSSSSQELAGDMPRDYFKRMAPSQEKEGEGNLADISGLLEHRKMISALYSRRLPALGFGALKENRDSENVLLRYPVRVANKQEVLKEALRKGVEIGSWFEIPLHPFGTDMAKFGYQTGMCPHSEQACTEVVNLPTHAKISESEVSRILEFLKRLAHPA